VELSRVGPAVTGNEKAAEVILGLVAAPSTPADLATSLRPDLLHELTARSPGVRWRVEQVVDGLVRPPADDVQIVAAARQMLLSRGWDLTVCLTDLPLTVARRPVVAYASPVQAVGLLSVPALGAVGTKRRARQSLLRLIDGLLGEPDGPRPDTPAGAAWARRRKQRLDSLAANVDPEGALRFTARVLSGNLNLLGGMIRANRPWRLAVRLSRALVAALAAGVFALVTPDIWRLADTYGGWRLGTIAFGAVAAIGATLLLGAGLLERARHPRMRRQVVLFNVATTATVLIGVIVFYAALLTLALVATLVLVVPGLLEGTLEHPVGIRNYLELAWFTSSLATAGGALGAGLETDEAVRQAAYTHRTNAATEQDLG
jgi:hypothetical protein